MPTNARKKAIKKIRADPRGPSHWGLTNPVLDDILKGSLKRSPFLMYRPSSWLPELYRAYFILRMQFWLLIKMEFLEPIRTPLNTIFSIVQFRKFIYTRLLVILLKITADRLRKSKYDSLPIAPERNEYMVPDGGPRNAPFLQLEDIVFKFLDTITNNAGKEMLAFFDEAIGKDPAQIDMVIEPVIFPVPVVHFYDYLLLTKEVSELVRDLIPPRKHEVPSFFTDERAKAFRDYVSDHVEGVVQKGMAEFRAVLDKDRKENQLPDNVGALFFSDEMKKLFANIDSDTKKDIAELAKDAPDFPADVPMFDLGKQVPLHEMTFFDFLGEAQFPAKILIEFLKFFKDVSEKYVDAKQHDEFRAMLRSAAVLLNMAPTSATSGIACSRQEIEAFLSLNGIPFDWIDRLTNESTREEDDISDPITSGWIFQKTLSIQDIFFFKDAGGRYHTSFYWLFDAVVGKYLKLLRTIAQGAKRASKAENYIGYLLEEYFKKRFPGAPYIKPFKLIIEHPTLSKGDKVLQEVKASLKGFKYDVRCIDLALPEFEIKHVFDEFDVVFPFKDTLIVIEVKDDLFWDVQDIPHLIRLWGSKIERKLKRKVDMLQKPEVVSWLSKEGITWKEIWPVIVTQGHVELDALKNVQDLYVVLEAIYRGQKDLKGIVHEPLLPYPW